MTTASACTRVALAAALVICGSACAAPPARDPFIEDRSSEAVIRFQGVVATPFELAYANLLRQVRSCWGRTAVDASSATPATLWQVRNDLDLTARTASIILVDPARGAGMAAASIRLREATGGTHVNGSALRSVPGAPHMGSEQIHLLQKWTMGEWTACDTP